MSERQGFSTRAIHAAIASECAAEADEVASAVHLSATYRWPDLEAGARFSASTAPTHFYRRWGSPNQRALEAQLATLEGTEAALCTASGMAAVSVALLAALDTPGTIVAARTLYGETATFLRTLAPRLGAAVRYAEGPEIEHFERLIDATTRAVVVEVPANPTLDLIDLAALSARAHAVGAVVLCDATLASPFNCRPAEWGVDVVLHSATKYLAGHSDAMGGVLASTRAFCDRAWAHHRVLGAVIAPFDAWLISRGVRTLALRMAQHNRSAEAVAEHLASHPAVASVWYPSLAHHPASEAAKRQHRGYGGVLSFALRGGDEAARRVVPRLKLFALATSLGGVESLVQYPASMAKLNPAQREALGISVGMVRLAVGCEDTDDLLDDLSQALEFANESKAP